MMTEKITRTTRFCPTVLAILTPCLFLDLLRPVGAQTFLPPERIDFDASQVDWSPIISSDLLELYFTRYRGPNDDDIYTARRENAEDPWEPTESVGNLVNSTSSENTGTLSDDGLTMIFGSRRPDGVGGWDLWQSTRVDTNSEWGEPVNLESINTAEGEATPSLSRDGLTLYFGSGVYPQDPTRDGGKDVWFSTRADSEAAWSKPKRLDAVNSGSFDSFPSISPDGLAIYFASDRAGTYGNEDIYVATRASVDEDFGEPLNMGPAINTPNIDIAPYVANDGSLYLTRDGVRSQPGWELWRAVPTPRISGDFDLNGQVNALDVDILTEAIGGNRKIVGSELNEDGIFDFEDTRVWVKEIKGTWFGDANLDGEFSNLDLIEVLQAGTYTQDVHAGWAEGDWTGDGRFDRSDILLALQDGGYGQGSLAAVRAVPEPSCAVLLLLGMLGIVRRRRAGQ